MHQKKKYELGNGIPLIIQNTYRINKNCDHIQNNNYQWYVDTNECRCIA